MEKQRPLVLVTNDDGNRIARTEGGCQRGAKVCGCDRGSFPAGSRQASGRAFPRTEDLGIIEEVPYEVDHFQVPAYAIHGSPAYAAAYGILELSPRKPDLCVSGINYGENSGNDAYL